MSKICVYPGSFDPITNGHEDIIRRAAEIFDKVIVGVLNNPTKAYWFSAEERVNLVKKSAGDLQNVTVDKFSGLLVDFIRKSNAKMIVRGLRALSDYEYELQIALTNNSLSGGDVETIFLPASREHLYLSSSVVKEVALYGGKISEFVNENIIKDIQEKVSTIKR